MTLKAYSPSDDDFVKDAFTNKRTCDSLKVDKPSGSSTFNSEGKENALEHVNKEYCRTCQR